MKCFGLVVLIILGVCEFIALPTVAMIWEFVRATPIQFMFTCFGVGVFIFASGAAFYFAKAGCACCSTNAKK